MTKFILHVGPHKTGTTYIQETLHALRGTLETRGIRVPFEWNAAPGLPSHMRLVWALRAGDVTTVQAQLQHILARNYPCVVVSCEALSRLDLNQVRQLRRMLGNAPAEIVYYARRWPERLPSLWQETVKFGHTHLLSEYLLEQLIARDGPELRDAAMLDHYTAVFGAPCVKLVSYSHLTDRNIDIASHFLATFLGAADLAPPNAGRYNPSLPILETETIRALNAIHARRGGERSPALREWYLANREGLVPVSIFAAMRANLGSVRLDEAAPQFAPISRDLLRRYGASVVPPHHETGLHAPRAIDVRFVRPDYQLDPGVAEALVDIHDRFLATLRKGSR